MKTLFQTIKKTDFSTYSIYVKAMHRRYYKFLENLWTKLSEQTQPFGVPPQLLAKKNDTTFID